MDSFEKELRDKLAALSDAQLAGVIGDIAQAVGADPAKARVLSNDIPRVRNVLGNMTDAQAQRLLASIDRQAAQQALDKLKNNL